MAYPTDPPSIYDEIIEDRIYCELNRTTIPVREAVVDEIARHSGETEIQIPRPDGASHVLRGRDPVPERDKLVEDLAAAQRELDELPVSTLTNLSDGHLGPLHYTDSTAHFAVEHSILDARPRGGTGPLPEQFESLGVKAAHLAEGFAIAESLPYHWVNDLGWEITQAEQVGAAMEEKEIPEDRAPPVEECFILNVPISFPAQSFGQATGAPAVLTNSAISRTERALDETLLTKRMAQLDSIETYHEILQSEIDRGILDREAPENLDQVVRLTFHISESGLASLRSQMKTREREAFQTVRRLSSSENFNYVMEEFAETVDELGELAMLGTKYREEVLDEPPGYY